MLDLLLPDRCAVCGRDGAGLCAGCVRALPRIRPPLCARCGAPTAWPVARCRECAGRKIAFAAARAAVAYDERVRMLVASWKERGRRRLADAAVAVTVEAVTRPPKLEAIVPVPPDRDRLLWRGHHPAETLARRLAAAWEVPLRPVLVRTGAAPRQRGLGLPERRRNVRNAFRAEASPRRVVLVDDVYTTGATVSAAASALRRAGAADVRVVTFARAIRRG